MSGQAEAQKNAGNSLLNSGDVEGAIAAYRLALEIDPTFVPALNNLALALKRTGQRQEGEKLLRKALALAPEDFELHNNLAVLLHEEARLDEAELSYRNALRIRPGDGITNGNFGGLLSQTGRGEEAIAYCLQAADASPDSIAVWSTLGKVLADVGQVEQAMPYLEKAATLPGSGIEQASAYLFALNYPPAMAGGLEWEAYVEFDRRHVQPRLAAGFSHPAKTGAPAKLRLGYVSGALSSHATYFFIIGVLSNHDHSRFEVFLYDTAIAKDGHTAHLASFADTYRDCVGLADRDLAERIHADRLDVLVDLDGHMGTNNAQLAMAWKPAPTQVTWLGYPHSTGSSAVDIWLSDRHITGSGFADPHSERLLLLPDFYMVFDPGPAPEVSPAPVLRNGYLTFGSFNAAKKINDEVLQTWARVVLSVPDARLLIAASPGPAFEQRVSEVLKQAGLAPGRVRFARSCPHPDFLALHHDVDIALDPFPVNGTTTSLFSLWMGLPLLAVAGVSHRARVGLSLMKNLGMAEWVAASPAELPGLARALTADLQRLAELRASLRERVRASPLCDAPKFTRALESLLREAAAG